MTSWKLVLRSLCRLVGGHDFGHLMDRGWTWQRVCERCGASKIGGLEWERVYENDEHVPTESELWKRAFSEKTLGRP